MNTKIITHQNRENTVFTTFLRSFHYFTNLFLLDKCHFEDAAISSKNIRL